MNAPLGTEIDIVGYANVIDSNRKEFTVPTSSSHKSQTHAIGRFTLSMFDKMGWGGQFGVDMLNLSF